MLRIVKAVAVCVAVMAATPVAAGTWAVSHSDQVDARIAAEWRIASVNVEVPNTLTVSEENRFAPSADIVWRGEAPGNRYRQVEAIMRDAAMRAAAPMKGRRPVHIEIRVMGFHGVTEKSRAMAPAAVHNIAFAIQVFDAQTGVRLTKTEVIQADLAAYTREDAVRADQIGLTQRVRIVEHVGNVLAGWMKHGPDQRHRFSSLGR